jgi:hypothetical protein
MQDSFKRFSIQDAAVLKKRSDRTRRFTALQEGRHG